jgi:uncharacterized membrane protein YoaK (UPF0700 family)
MNAIAGTTGNPVPAAAGSGNSLPFLLLILTLVTGLVDAISYLKLGHVFVANMTGNIVFLGFAVAGASGFSIPASLAAIAAFLVGALIGGRMGVAYGSHRGRLLLRVLALKVALVAGALALALLAGNPDEDAVRYGLIAFLALTMGLQNATARRISVPDLTTTVLTLTLTGLAADSTLAGGTGPRAGRRVLSTFTMFAGAAVGAALVLKSGVAAALAVTLLLDVIAALWAVRLSLMPEEIAPSSGPVSAGTDAKTAP